VVSQGFRRGFHGVFQGLVHAGRMKQRRLSVVI
jgi:hypothetical protein